MKNWIFSVLNGHTQGGGRMSRGMLGFCRFESKKGKLRTAGGVVNV